MPPTPLDAVGFIGGLTAVTLFWFTASRGNRLLLSYLKEREAVAAVHVASSTLSGKRSRDNSTGVHAWYDDTRLMFYSLTIFSAVAYSTTTLAQLMAPATSVLRTDGIESDAMSLANVAAYLSMVSAVIWTIAHGIMLEYKRTHSLAAMGGAGGGGASGGKIHSAKQQRNNNNNKSGSRNNADGSPIVSSATAGGGAGVDTRSSMGKGFNNMYAPSAHDESIEGDTEQSYGGSSAAGIDDIYFEDDDDDTSYPNIHQQHHLGGSIAPQPPSDYSLHTTTGGGGATADASHVTSFSQGYGSTQHLTMPGGTRGSGLSASDSNRPAGGYGGAAGGGGDASSSSGPSCCTMQRILDKLFPYRLIISVVVVITYYLAITAMTERGLVSGANFSAGFSFLMGLICGVLAVGSTLFLCERGAVVAARRFGLALTVLFVCLIARGVAVLGPVQEHTPGEIFPMVIPLIDSFSITCVIVVLPSKQFCLCMDLN